MMGLPVGIVVGICFSAVVLGCLGLGASINASEIAKKCELTGKVVINEKVYECKPIK